MTENLENKSNINVRDMDVVDKLANYLFNEANDLYKYNNISRNSSVKNRAIRVLMIVPESFKGIYEEPFCFSIESVLKTLYKNGKSNTETYKKLYAAYNLIRKYARKEKFEPENKENQI